MRDDEPEMVLVCSPADWPHHVPGVTLDAACGHLVHVSEEGMVHLLGSPGMRLMCVPCATAGGYGEPGHPPQVVPGALDAIERTQGTEARAEAERWARERGWDTLG